MTRLLLALSLLTSVAAAPVRASAEECGWYAFAGAFSDHANAQERAGWVDGRVFDGEYSSAVNAWRGLFIVASGPSSEPEARQERRRIRRLGVHDAYVDYRCFY